MVIENVDRIADGSIVEAMQLCLAEGDDGYETGAEVLRLALMYQRPSGSMRLQGTIAIRGITLEAEP